LSALDVGDERILLSGRILIAKFTLIAHAEGGQVSDEWSHWVKLADVPTLFGSFATYAAD
jgi:hypothetical protein